MDIDQFWRARTQALERLERSLQSETKAFKQFEQAERVAHEWFNRELLPAFAHYEEHLKQLALQAKHHEEYLQRRRKRCEAMLAENKRCGRENCGGILSIQETRADETDVVIGVSLACDRCAYEKYPSPEYACYEAADEFLASAIQLDGTPPFPASFNAYWACELYLRELGGSYYYSPDGDEDEGEFRPSSNRHGLSTLRNSLPRPRRIRLDAEQHNDRTFLELFKQLPNGLLAFLRYREEGGLSYPERAERPKLCIDRDGRLLICGANVYETLVHLGLILQRFVGDEFRRNR